MRRLIDSFGSVAFFLVALPLAFALTVEALVRDLAVSLRNIWSRP